MDWPSSPSRINITGKLTRILIPINDASFSLIEGRSSLTRFLDFTSKAAPSEQSLMMKGSDILATVLQDDYLGIRNFRSYPTHIHFLLCGFDDFKVGIDSGVFGRQ